MADWVREGMNPSSALGNPRSLKIAGVGAR